ncbi:MAG TPA: alpha-L-fucosidase, partial [Ruminococcaceae bacterium]|nr:alpha-L-fucosidase [Oscillospiraceae bacterium]
FQIDGNFGAVSGVCEMLLDCFDGKIYLLPALPDKWSDGSVRGLLAKGNIKVDMTWSGGKLTSYSLTGKGKANIVYGGKETVHELDGSTLTVRL